MAPVIDSHLHIWSEDTRQYPRADVPYPGSAELLLAYMAEGGVDHSVIVLSMHYQYDNRLLDDTLKAYPDKFAGVGVLDPRGQEAADNLAKLVEETDIRGIRVRGAIEPDCFCTPDTDPLWQKAAELNVPICVLGRPEQIGQIRQIIQRNPETPAVIDHFAQIPAALGTASEPFQTFLSLAQFPNVYIKLSGLHYWGDPPYPFQKAQNNLKAAIEAFGPKRVMWGSDWPHILFGYGYIRCLNFVRRELTWLSEEDKAQILGRTAHSIWWEK